MKKPQTIPEENEFDFLPLLLVCTLLSLPLDVIAFIEWAKWIGIICVIASLVLAAATFFVSWSDTRKSLRRKAAD